MNNTAVLEGIRCILRLYEELCAPLRERYGLSQSKIDVIAFLANNPGRDTQSDIAELRNIPKANVSLCVSDLMERGMIKRTVDPSDRRISHLSLCGAAEEIAEELKRCSALLKTSFLQDSTRRKRSCIQA